MLTVFAAFLVTLQVTLASNAVRSVAEVPDEK